MGGGGEEVNVNVVNCQMSRCEKYGVNEIILCEKGQNGTQIQLIVFFLHYCYQNKDDHNTQ